ncbi:class I SAM-dependent methyltransferase [Streptomyces sp. NPDC050560]|uniref:class I SAM-dependent methyltransferase n=1 Tax=Streptomyces sp. NPDC050560 TaxID=3365630 RepID=UPI00379427DD
MTTTTRPADWAAWQRSWDRQQEWYMPDREERFRVLLDMVEALAGRSPRVLDLACGTGSITDRLLRRLPQARSTCLDLDPALMAIARGHFEGDARVTFVTADLTDPDWPGLLPHDSYDAVVTATALHWLDTAPLRRLYGALAGVVRPGGVFLNADHMEDPTAPRINAAVRAFHTARREREQAGGADDWAAWWARVAADEHLREPALRRFTLLGDPRDPTPRGPRTDRPTTTHWHTETLRTAGFTEARQAWCSPSDALVVALR